jgi:hypothetical protein
MTLDFQQKIPAPGGSADTIDPVFLLPTNDTSETGITLANGRAINFGLRDNSGSFTDR